MPFDEKRIQELIKEVMQEEEVATAGNQVNTTQSNPAPQQAPQTEKPKVTLVKFDTKTDAPFDVKFSERGFSINGTRMSFENLESAINKNYVITLDAGTGLVLDLVKMQKIMKYKDMY